MKVLLKKDICESHKLCTDPLKSLKNYWNTLLKKKEKKEKHETQKRGHYPNGYLLKNGQVCESYDI